MRSTAWAAVGVTMLAACAGGGADSGDTSGGAGGGGSPAGSGAGGTSSGSTTSTSSTKTGTTGTTTTSTTSSKGTGGGSVGGTSNLTILTAPSSGLVGQVVSAIQAAKTSVHMTMYILDNSQVINALIAQKQAGRDVRVVLNQTFPSGTNESNPTTYTKLTQAGIGVVWRNGPPGAASGAYTHEKAFVVDGKVAWIMSMNLDASAGEYNREYLVIDQDPADVAEADGLFLADYAGTGNASGPPLVVSPDNARSALVSLIDASTTTLDIEVEEFSDTYSAGITAAVVAAAKRGVTTRIVVANATPSTNQVTSIAQVKAAGAHVVVSGGTDSASTASNPYIHAKAITIDCNGTTCARGFLGSENFSGGSLGYNRELGVLVDNPTQLAQVESAIAHDFSVGTPQ